jgi:hypothetical protein
MVQKVCTGVATKTPHSIPVAHDVTVDKTNRHYLNKHSNDRKFFEDTSNLFPV